MQQHNHLRIKKHECKCQGTLKDCPDCHYRDCFMKAEKMVLNTNYPIKPEIKELVKWLEFYFGTPCLVHGIEWKIVTDGNKFRRVLE